ncbi:TPA: restriction endonuclease subunit S [Kluyvera ascorbata]|nr:restriction endonuclease subunit S [Kluyvera ascorbata]
MAKYKAYSEYRGSGVEWLGEIPYHWEMLQHKYIAYFTKGKNPTILLDTPSKKSLPYLSMDCLRNNSVDKYAIVSNDIRVAVEGQPLIVWDGSNAGEFIKGKKGILSSTMAAATLNYPLCMQYYWYLCTAIEPEMRKHAIGMGIPHVNGDELKSIQLGIPSIQEQEKIASFLDHETIKIDNLIEKQQQLIELLKEKRQAVISHAVTKGLNPDVPMKDSGVEWLAEVPEHWDISSLGYYTSIITGATPDRSKINYWDGNIPWIKTGEINYKIIYSSEEKITNEAVKNTSTRISPPGTLLMAMYGQGKTRGRVAILGTSATYNQACAAISPNESLLNVFLEIFFIAGYHAIRDGGNETSQMNLNIDIIKKFKILIPPISEQRKIVDYLDCKLPRLDILMERATATIVLMQERRTVLISAAVTGKIDVRNWVASAPETETLPEAEASA